MIAHGRCLVYALLGGLTGCGVAWAQAPGLDVLVDPTASQLLLAVIENGGWPGVLAFLGWLSGQGRLRVPITVTVVHELKPAKDD